MQARKKPVTIDYFEIHLYHPTIEENIQEWMRTFGDNFDDHFFLDNDELKVKTLEGTSYVVDPELDYIIRGVNGEYYPCKKDIFEKTYNKL